MDMDVLVAVLILIGTAVILLIIAVCPDIIAVCPDKFSSLRTRICVLDSDIRVVGNSSLGEDARQAAWHELLGRQAALIDEYNSMVDDYNANHGMRHFEGCG